MKKRHVFIGRKSIIRDVSSADEEKYLCIENGENPITAVNGEIHSCIDLKKHVWIDESQNGHTFLSGQSGSGKSFLLQKMVMQAVFRGDSVIAIDVGNCFSEEHMEDMLKSAIQDKFHIYTYVEAGKLVIPINPFSQKKNQTQW